MIIAFIVLVVLFGLFGWWNQAPAPIQFLGWHYETIVGLAVIVPLILGLLIGFVISWGKQQLLRGQLPKAEASTKSAEGKLREITRQTEIASEQQEQEREP